MNIFEDNLINLSGILSIKAYISAVILCLVLVPGVSVSKESVKYRAVVSFYSICCGPDSGDVEAVQEFIKAFEEKYKVELEFENRSWGMEGEWDMCFKLDEVNSAAQLEFVDGVKDAIDKRIAGKDNTRNGGTDVYENRHCE